ncbi:P-loop containing nucleoside triphosphate hydrolase protein [Exidia glandulosa HHB12029]|uniref:p-loop containing nucleoside triphosphate hydrolase protein n=1 Tax=Exidia glandulosa HHB12029 TaxID=1314781 RepID=A0A165KVT5_EXIGL|nr:P-loop containing nucleoside triphosphate hydrolase protein [Exidia glandulosa HHB12029]
MSLQLPLWLGAQNDQSTWPLYLPLLAAAWSCAFLLFTTYHNYTARRRDSRIFVWDATLRRATRTTRALAVARAVGCVVLLALSGYAVADDDEARSSADLALLTFYLYVAVVSAAACMASTGLGRVLQTHLTILLLVPLASYIYRDLWPLATFTLKPADDSAWGQIFVLIVVGVLIPLATPTVYIPIDATKYQDVPAPEQTASLLSFMFYAFVDPLVKLGYRSEHLSLDMLPPVADYDRAAHVREMALPLLDKLDQSSLPAHAIGWRLLALFWTDFAKLGVGLVIRVTTSFGSPVGLNRLLHYVETGGNGALVKPWVWIALLFLDPMLQSIGMQWYFFTASRLAVRLEALVTQLVFARALRMRQASESENVVGRMNNLVTSDLANVVAAKDSLLLFVNVPLQVAVATYFLYTLLGWSSLVGLLVMVACFPLPGWIAAKLNFITTEQMKRTDARVQQVSEVMRVLRMVKMFAWEPKMQEKLTEKRDEELHWIRRAKITALVNKNLNHIIPLLTMIATYATFTLVMRRELSASIVFSSMALFEMLRNQLETAGFCIPLVVQVKVSLDRLSEFLSTTPLLDRYTSKHTKPCGDVPADFVDSRAIGFHNATFTYTASPSESSFQLRIPGPAPLLFTPKALNLVVGPTGAGKSSLLLALLGEMHLVPHHSNLHFTGDESWYNLPRERGIAYVPQEGWVLAATVRDNILFDAPFEKERYERTIKECALERDLEAWDAGDVTEIGERGVTLSGGQRARITLARAVYSRAETVLLDDVLSALDVHTARWIVDQCLNGELLRGRTVILVTHNVPLVAHLVHSVISVHDGLVQQQDSVERALDEDPELQAEVRKVEEVLRSEERPKKEDEKVDDEKKADGKLVADETLGIGRVQWPACAYPSHRQNRPTLMTSLYFYALGGVAFWAAFLCSMFGSEILKILQTWFLGYWAALYDTRPASDVPVGTLVGEYAVLLLFSLLIYSAAFGLFVFGSMQASRTIHARLVSSVLGATMRWLDITPPSRVVARCTQDIHSVDGPLSDLFTMLVELTTSLVCKFVTVIIMSPVFVLPGMVIFGVGWVCGRIYMKAQMPVKREMSNAKAPVLGHFSAAVSGLVSLRAYGAEEEFADTLARLIDNYTRAARSFDNLSRWVCIRVHAMGGLFAAGLATFLIYGSRNLSAGTIGFSLAIAISFSGMVSHKLPAGSPALTYMQTLAWVMITNMFEVESNSLERILDFVDIEQEPASTDAGTPPAYWPASGKLRVDNLSAKYSRDGPLVLRDVTFSVTSGERVAVVGRTGSGKTSLTLALLRCLLTTGQVNYDGMDTRKINLHALRSNITIIPQQPELLDGSLRQNLDPFEEHDDPTLNNALSSAGLAGKLTLDSHLASAGENLSLGQRQMVALARALVRRSKVVILDEATAAVDHETDAAIQNALRTELAGTTLLTVAHRLRTVMDYDKVMVLDAGHIVEFDTPSALLRKDSGFLRSLVDESPDKHELLALVTGFTA